MKFLSIELRKPTNNELTAAVVMGVGLWIAALGLSRLLGIDLGRGDAGALLVVVLWSCVSARLGIRIDKGRQHLLANLAVSGVLLGVYQSAWAFAA